MHGVHVDRVRFSAARSHVIFVWFLTRAYSLVVRRVIRIDEAGVRFSLGPPIRKRLPLGSLFRIVITFGYQTLLNRHNLILLSTLGSFEGKDLAFFALHESAAEW